jgi:hypothetical protein
MATAFFTSQMYKTVIQIKGNNYFLTRVNANKPLQAILLK